MTHRRSRLAAAVLLAVVLPLLAPFSGWAADAVAQLPDSQSGCLPTSTTSEAAVPWAQKQLAPQEAWRLTDGSGVTVAIVDTGVEADAPQLAGHVLPGLDVVNPGGGPGDTDCYGHGTFVAGIVAAAVTGSTGFAGLAPGVMLLPVRVANNGQDATAVTLASGIRSAVDGGASVINVSASTTVATPSLKAAVDYAEQHNVVVVASAANSAQSGDPVTYPASYPTVLAVGAIDSTGARADFSQTGSYLGLVAPGVNVLSIGPRGNGQWQGSGTSYAAPFVTATTALVRAYRPELTAAQVRHRVEVTADHPAASLPDPGLGWGEVNPMAAVSTVLPDEAGGTAIVHPRPARTPVPATRDGLGPNIAAVAAVAVLCLAFVVRMSWRYGRVGARRHWRRARVVRCPPSLGAGSGPAQGSG